MIYWNHKNKTQITNERNEKEMKLQVALDVGFTTETARSLINEIKDSVDIIEVGTPFLLEKGLEPVAKLKDSFPEKEILADMNTCADKAFELLKREVKKSKLALAGGISRKNIEIYAAIEPDVIIVGEGITGAADPKGEAEYIKAIMRKYE